MKTWNIDEGHCLIIAEVAQAHDGSLGMAHAYVDAAARAGADAVKFQTHIADAESTLGEPWRVRFSLQDRTRFDYWRRMEFTEEGWSGLRRHAEEAGLLFISSPFSLEAVDLLERIGVDAWKIASGEVSNVPLIERLAGTQRPILISSGMSQLSEIERAIQIVRATGSPLVVLQCTSAYPCPPEKIGLNLITELRERLQCPVGLSDHSGTIYAGLAAVTLGIEVLELHITMSREMFGPDVQASITTAELRQLVEGIRFIERMRAHPVDKDEIAEEMAPLRVLFTKSIVAGRDLTAGTELTLADLRVKKPGTGLPATRLESITGRVLRTDRLKDDQILDKHLEPQE